MIIIFTFGYGQTDPKTGASLADRYVRVEAESRDAAAERMIDRFGHRYPGRALGNWAFDYPDEETAGVERWGLVEIDFATGADRPLSGKCGRDGCTNPPAEGSDWCTPCNQDAVDRMRPLSGKEG